jgi:hypothetical protein
MKTYLPHYFKQIGILLVLTAIVFSFIGEIDGHRRSFIEGQIAASKHSRERTQELNTKLKKIIEAEPYMTKEESNMYIMISLFFSITGFFLFLFSKEKIDDEFIQQLRLKSIFQTLIATWLIYGLIKLLFRDYQLEGIYILQLQLIVYVIIYKYNKDWKFDPELESED